MGEMVLSSACQIPQLKNIWLTCFPEDTRETVDLFFDMVYKPEECLVRIEAGAPVSMVFMLPAVFMCGDVQWPVQYIYAAATLPQWQKRGYFGQLLKKSLEMAEKMGQKASFLRPGEESLFSYYQRFGYKPFFYREYITTVVEPSVMVGEMPIEEVPYTSFAALRDEVLSLGYGGHDHALPTSWIKWSGRLAGYAARSAVLSGGGILRSPQGYAVYEADIDSIAVKELVCPEEEKQAYIAYFSHKFPGKTIHLSMPVKDMEKAQPFGVLLPLGSDRMKQMEFAVPYMGLALD